MLNFLPFTIIGAADLLAAFLFMYGLKRMSSPVSAPSGIRLAGWGMVAAVLASFLYVFGESKAAHSHLFANLTLAVLALGLGGGTAWWSGKKAKLTAMPQMVALYNGMGGGAAGAIAAVELFGFAPTAGMTSLLVNREDMAEALGFAAEGKVKADIELQPLSAINKIFERLKHGDVAARVVLDFTKD